MPGHHGAIPHRHARHVHHLHEWRGEGGRRRIALTEEVSRHPFHLLNGLLWHHSLHNEAQVAVRRATWT